MASKTNFVDTYVKFYKEQWGAKWAEDTFGAQYKSMFDWVHLHTYVPAITKGKSRTDASYKFNLGKGKNFHISEAEVLESKSKGEILGMCFINIHLNCFVLTYFVYICQMYYLSRNRRDRVSKKSHWVPESETNQVIITYK